MTYNTNSLVFQNSVRPTWLPDDRFWYRNTVADGAEFILVDPARGTRRARVRSREAGGRALKGGRRRLRRRINCRFRKSNFLPTGNSSASTPRRKNGSAMSRGAECVSEGAAPPAAGADAAGGAADSGPARNDAQSPDKQHTAFIRNYNLWMRDAGTNKETQLTTDGVKDFGYATDNAGWTTSDRPILVWSPDSKKIATFQQDQRGVGEMYLVSTTVGHPRAEGVEISAARRRTCHHDPARDHRCRRSDKWCG